MTLLQRKANILYSPLPESMLPPLQWWKPIICIVSLFTLDKKATCIPVSVMLLIRWWSRNQCPLKSQELRVLETIRWKYFKADGNSNLRSDEFDNSDDQVSFGFRQLGRQLFTLGEENCSGSEGTAAKRRRSGSEGHISFYSSLDGVTQLPVNNINW